MNKLPALLALVACGLLPAHAHAVEPLDTFSVRVSGYVTRFDTQVRADGETRRGSRVDLRRDLGLDGDDVIALAGVTWRPWERHEFGLSYYQDDRDATRRLERDIEFDGTVYHADATVRSDVDLDAYQAYYTWWLASHERWALGPRVGLVWYALDLGLTLEAETDGEPVGGAVRNEISGDLPAPSIGGSLRWTPGEDWRLSAELGYFSANVDEFDADILFGHLGIEWFPWTRVGITLDYTRSEIDVDAEKQRFSGNLDFVDSGVRLGVVYRF